MDKTPSKNETSRQVRIKHLCGLARILDLSAIDIDTLDQALTHTSYANEHKKFKVQHNERLEFLGDAVLDLIIADYLYRTYPNMSEGQLTKVKAAIVCEERLVICSARLRLGEYLLLGHGERRCGGAMRPSILADTFEAIIGAIFSSMSFEEATRFALRELKDALDIAGTEHFGEDYKTLLQERVQRWGKNHSIVYELRAAEGPDHNKLFTMAVIVDGEELGQGEGKAKKIAEQRAAAVALRYLASKA